LTTRLPGAQQVDQPPVSEMTQVVGAELELEAVRRLRAGVAISPALLISSLGGHSRGKT
jgi:hypothetical protein